MSETQSILNQLETYNTGSAEGIVAMHALLDEMDKEFDTSQKKVQELKHRLAHETKLADQAKAKTAVQTRKVNLLTDKLKSSELKLEAAATDIKIKNKEAKAARRASKEKSRLTTANRRWRAPPG